MPTPAGGLNRGLWSWCRTYAVRGSGGRFNGFSQEAADTDATLTWVRGLPECNGRIGVYGFSYQGFTQLLAQTGSTLPDCLAPAMTGLDEREHWSCEGEPLVAPRVGMGLTAGGIANPTQR